MDAWTVSSERTGFSDVKIKALLSEELIPPVIDIKISDESIDAMKCLNMLGKWKHHSHDVIKSCGHLPFITVIAICPISCVCLWTVSCSIRCPPAYSASRFFSIRFFTWRLLYHILFLFYFIFLKVYCGLVEVKWGNLFCIYFLWNQCITMHFI